MFESFKRKESTCRRDGQQTHKQLEWHDSSCLLIQVCSASTSFIIYREKPKDSTPLEHHSSPLLYKEDSTAFFAPSMACHIRSASAPSSPHSNETSVEETIPLASAAI
jgi:hypothetical protein